MAKPKKRYKFFFNTYPNYAFTKCPKCDTKTKVRKYPLVIGIDVEPKQILFFNKKCKYCPSCDLIIAKKQELESLIPQLGEIDYLVIGTLDRKDWVQGNKGSLSSAEITERMYIFKTEWEFEIIPAGWYRDDD